ncbi:MAG: M23 family metallopeptidase, partial [Opitutaceae bacterium]|nr:M23 family metallopeptidase [Opitutaceae bacterium]
MTGGGGLRRGGLTLLLACACGALPAALPPLVWPTPNRAWLDGRGIAEYIQPTVSGDPASGLFGGWRSGGNQFHGGVDLLPVSRDARGEAADPVFAAMPGVVRHTNTRAGDSSYGRYIVIEHTGTEPAALTLYAHLAAVSVAPGDVVKAGQVVGKMGRSAGGYSIPRERAHLHFEICLRLTDNFQAWYDRQKFGSPNKHGVWNGLNMARLDPLAFLNACREGRTRGLAEWLRGMEEAARVRVAAARTPDFVTRYPAL